MEYGKKSEESLPARLEVDSKVTEFARFTQGLDEDFSLSEVSAEVACRKPLSELVETFLAATSRSKDTVRSYRRIPPDKTNFPHMIFAALQLEMLLITELI